MLILAGILLVLVLVYLPQLWVGWVLNHYARVEPGFPGTGGELARHLLRRLGLEQVGVELADSDHYDPLTRTVRLRRLCHDGKSLTAIVTAAHEVGHAIQHAADEPMFRWRTRAAVIATQAARLGSFLLFLSPFLPLIARSPVVGAVTALAAFLVVGTGAVLHLLTLPVEWDASFGKALPLLEAGFLPPQQVTPARRILRACALTYVAASLAGLLNFWRWIQVLRR